ncbi:MAG: molybdopterin oxidoreductase [Spirosoma sp.]|nr:molybdopterin oxidoreductase [Spirosoma sp.]
MHLGNYLGLVHESEQELAEALRKVGAHHADEPDIFQICQLLASWSDQHVQQLKPFIKKYSEDRSSEPDKLSRTLFDEPRKGSLALMRDLHDLWLLSNEVELCWIVIYQAAMALHDKELEATCNELSGQTKRQTAWLLTRIKQSAPQSLIVAA